MAYSHSHSEQLPLFHLVVLVPLFLLPLLYLFIRRSSKVTTARSSTGDAWESRRRAPPPGPPKQLPVLGNLLQLGSRPHRYFQAVARTYGPVVQVQLGRVRAVVVSSPEAAREVLRTNDAHCCSRPDSPGPRMLSYGFKDVGFSPYSDYWCEMRKLFTTELLSARRVQSFAYARAAGVARLVDSIAADAESPAVPVDLSAKLYELNDGIIGTVAFGRMHGSAQFRHNDRSFQQVMEEMLLFLGSFTFEEFFPASCLARWADVLTGVTTRRRRVFRMVDGFLDSVIEKHMEPERLRAGVQEDIVDALVKMMMQDDLAFRLTRDHVKAIRMDPCAVTMIWVMSELMRNPRVMRKAQAEVRELVRNKPKVEEDDVKNLRYLLEGGDQGELQPAPAGTPADPEGDHGELRDRWLRRAGGHQGLRERLGPPRNSIPSGSRTATSISEDRASSSSRLGQGGELARWWPWAWPMWSLR